MKKFEFNEEKNIVLKKTRGISFEEVIEIINSNHLLADTKHYNKKYPHQRVYVIELNRYAYVIPYIFKTKDTVFLKTIYPSRVFTKKFIRRYEKEKN